MLAVGGTLRAGRESLKRDRHEIISMYTEPPSEETTLDEFELFALDRLMVLRKIDEFKARGMKPHELKEPLSSAVSKYMRLSTMSESFDEDLRKDVVSHFILRLAYCRTEELRRWFLAQECALFKHRLETLPSASLASFIHSNGLSFQIISAEDKASRRARLLSIPGTTLLDFERSTYYKIPFMQAAKMVEQRAVYLESGFAYVPLHKVVDIVVSRFRMGLSRSLAEASAAFANVAGDPRFGPLLQNMSKQYVGKDYAGAGSGDGIRPAELDTLAQRSMPLCMRNLHSALNREHKLKHQGRLQYGLFLKGAGLSMEDALVFWQGIFTKIMTVDQFAKQYAYNVRHMYGKEGKRTNYTPYSCLKIILGNGPGGGEYHGCPYRHFDESHLSSLLGQLRLDREDKDAMIGLVRSKGYGLACQRHFEATHKGFEAAGVIADNVGSHPNAWTAASMQFYKAKEGDKQQQQPAAAAAAAAAGGGSSGASSGAAVVAAAAAADAAMRSDSTAAPAAAAAAMEV